MKITTFVCIALSVICISCTNNKEAQNASENVTLGTSGNDSNESLIIKKFITEMYNDGKFNDENFMLPHCSDEMIQKLRDEYDYECEDGDCYAFWLFRSGHNGENPNSDYSTRLISITENGDGWFTYEYLDMGWKGENKIKVELIDDKVIIDDVQNIECEK